MLRSFTTRFAGLLILALGIWGGIIAFVGPYFGFTLGPNHAWTWTTARLWLDVLPAAAAVLGGLVLLDSGPRALGRFGAMLALLAGAWFAVGPSLSEIWHAGGAQGVAHGSATVRGLEMLSLHTGLGVLIAALAAYALPGALIARAPRVRASAPAGTGATAGTSAARPAGGGGIGEPTTSH
jgi:hypothetical protein